MKNHFLQRGHLDQLLLEVAQLISQFLGLVARLHQPEAVLVQLARRERHWQLFGHFYKWLV